MEKGPKINTVFKGKALKCGQARSNLLTWKHQEGFSSQAVACLPEPWWMPQKDKLQSSVPGKRDSSLLPISAGGERAAIL